MEEGALGGLPLVEGVLDTIAHELFADTDCDWEGDDLRDDGLLFILTSTSDFDLADRLDFFDLVVTHPATVAEDDTEDSGT